MSPGSSAWALRSDISAGSRNSAAISSLPISPYSFPRSEAAVRESFSFTVNAAWRSRSWVWTDSSTRERSGNTTARRELRSTVFGPLLEVQLMANSASRVLKNASTPKSSSQLPKRLVLLEVGCSPAFAFFQRRVPIDRDTGPLFGAPVRPFDANCVDGRHGVTETEKHSRIVGGP